jgi:hypothetical protein
MRNLPDIPDNLNTNSRFSPLQDRTCQFPLVVMVFAKPIQICPAQKHMPTGLLITLYTRPGLYIFHGSRPGLGMPRLGQASFWGSCSARGPENLDSDTDFSTPTISA